MLDLTLIMVVGILTGVFTGFIPGLHPNTLIFLFLPVYLGSSIQLMSFMSFIVGLSVSHTFHSFLPAIFMGIPEAESALASLPGADMAANGRGIPAFKYTLLGGMFAMFFLALFSVVLFFFLEPVYGYIEGFMAYILVLVLVVLVLRKGELLKGVSTVFLTGLLGHLALSGNFNQQYILIPVFAGMFAFPQIWKGLEQDLQVPEQGNGEIDQSVSRRGGFFGFVAGLIAGIFPGLGPAVSTSFLAPRMSSTKEFLAGMGGVNTSDIVMSFLALYLIGKSRSGASVALQALDSVRLEDVMFLAGMCFLATSVSGILAVRASRVFVGVLQRLDFQKVLLSVGLFLFSVTSVLTGWRGVMVLFASFFVGMKAVVEGNRALCMSVLIVPAILFYLGI